MKAEERNARLSGGQRRRLAVGWALVGDPELLFLDEPTTGFDPQPAGGVGSGAGLREGRTVVLTTHYMDEAQALADEVAIIARGRIVAQGAPNELGGRETAGTRIQFRLPGDVAAAELPEVAREAMESADVETQIVGVGHLANTHEKVRAFQRLGGPVLLLDGDLDAVCRLRHLGGL